MNLTPAQSSLNQGKGGNLVKVLDQLRGGGNILLIGTSFPVHVELILGAILTQSPPELVYLIISESVFSQLGEIPAGINNFLLPSHGPLAFGFDREIVRQIRQLNFQAIVLPYHDPEFQKNRRAELLALLCRTKTYLLTTIAGDFQHLTRQALTRKIVIGASHGTKMEKLILKSYLMWVRLLALRTVTGRRLLASRWGWKWGAKTQLKR